MRDEAGGVGLGVGPRVEEHVVGAADERDHVGLELERALELLLLHLLARGTDRGQVLVAARPSARATSSGPARLAGLEAGGEAVAEGDVGHHSGMFPPPLPYSPAPDSAASAPPAGGASRAARPARR